MRSLLQRPERQEAGGARPLWVALHGAGGDAEQALHLFGGVARAAGAYLLAPQGTRPSGRGSSWSYARDVDAIARLVDGTTGAHRIDRDRLGILGFSMGCVMGLWLLARAPARYRFLAAGGMGSAFEPWELDDGGVDEAGLRAAARGAALYLAVDRRDPAGCAAYFAANRDRLRGLGFAVATYQPDERAHGVTGTIEGRLQAWLAGLGYAQVSP